LEIPQFMEGRGAYQPRKHKRWWVERIRKLNYIVLPLYPPPKGET
jgi:hypothetical protein